MKPKVKITQNSELFPEKDSVKFSDVLMYFSESLLNIDDEEAILWDLAKNCIAKLGFVDCVVYMLDEESLTMIQKAAYGPKNPKDLEIYKPVDIPLGSGIVGHVALTGNAELIHDTSKDDRYKMDDEYRLSEICVPIIIDGKVIGVIDCEHPEKDFFSEHHLHMLLTISSIIAIKIKGVRTQIKYIEEQQKSIEIQKQLIDLKLKVLNSQLNPHFVFNALNAIQYFITVQDKKSALEYLSIFSKLIRYYLKNIEEEVVPLNDEINLLNWYLKLQKLRYDEKLNFKINKDHDTHQSNVKIPAFLIQTLVENLIEHAIFNECKNQELDIHFHADKYLINLIINFNHDPIPLKQVKYTPEYRNKIMDWQDQIRLLNANKPYHIKKHISFIKNKSFITGNIIKLTLPNLE